MKLPNHERVRIPRDKITDYLLSPTHEDVRFKEVFFRSYGFTAEAWETLATAFRRHADHHEVVRQADSPLGVRYVIEGRMDTPDGRTALVRTVWFIAKGEQTARFVTAYPLRKLRR